MQSEEVSWDISLSVNTSGDGKAYKTVQAAAEAALKYASRDSSVRIQVAPGTYRETVRLQGTAGKGYAPILIEGTSANEVLISGSEVLNGWQLNDRSFEHPWPQDANTIPHLFVQGVRVEYVPDAQALGVGQCRLVQDDAVIEMLPPRNAVVTDGTVELATRPELFLAENLTSLVLRDITFVQGAVVREKPPEAVSINNVESVELRNVRIEANGIGLGIGNTDKLTLTGLDCVRNRLGGARLFACHNVKILGGSFNLNGLEPSARSHDAYGLYSYKSAGFQVERTEFNENRNGLSLKYNRDETKLRNLHVYLNQELGVQLAPCDNLDVNGAQLVCRGDAQLMEITGTRGVIRNTIMVAEGGTEPLLSFLGVGTITLTNNILAGFDHEGPLLDLGGVVDLSKAAGNLYYSSNTESAFAHEGLTMNFTEWQEATKEDTSSAWGDPLFSNRDRFDFSLRPDSPWFQK